MGKFNKKSEATGGQQNLAGGDGFKRDNWKQEVASTRCETTILSRQSYDSFNANWVK